MTEPSEKKRMPLCLGEYESGNAECDGSSSATSDDERMACVFRDRCVAFRRMCREAKERPERFLRWRKMHDDDGVRRQYAFSRMGDEKFAAALSKIIARYEIKNGRITNRRGDVNKQKRRRRAKPKAVRTLPTVEPGKAADHAYALAAWFWKRLEESSGVRIHDLPGSAGSGEFYLVDRTETSNYTALYMRFGAKKIAVASAYPNLRDGSLQVRIALSLEKLRDNLQKDEAAELSLEDYSGKDGNFKTRVRGLDKARAAMVADALSRITSVLIALA